MSATQKIREILASTKPFCVLSPQGVEKLAASCHLCHLPADAVLLNDGELTENAYILATGHLHRSLVTPEGRKFTVNDTFPVKSFALVAAIGNCKHQGVIEAIEDSEIVAVPGKAILDVVACEPDFAVAIAKRLSSSSIRQTEALKDLMYPVPIRLARLIFRGMDRDGVYELTSSKAALAEILATVPETLSRAFGTLKDEGLIKVDRRTIRVLDAGRLREYAQFD